MKLTSLLTELDEKFLPSLIDGEQRVLVHDDNAIAASAPRQPEYAVLTAQRAAVRQRIAAM